MSIWQKPISVDILNGIHTDTVVGTLGIEFVSVGDDSITARVPETWMLELTLLPKMD